MLIEDEFTVPAPLDEVWNFMLDVPRVVPCMPGAELTETIDQNSFRGRMRTSLGPVTLTFHGSAEIVEQNEAARRVVIKAEGAEEKGQGQASMNVTSILQSAGDGTRVQVSQDLNLSGAAAQYGRGMIQDVAGVLLRQFADCVSTNIERVRRGESPMAGEAAPVKGMTLGVTYVLMSIKRFFRRLFGLNFR
jgi:carbon monoxide dehydrogenase subunit G